MLSGEHANVHQNDSWGLRGVAGGDGELGCLCGKAGTSHPCDGSSGWLVNALLLQSSHSSLVWTVVYGLLLVHSTLCGLEMLNQLFSTGFSTCQFWLQLLHVSIIHPWISVFIMYEATYITQAYKLYVHVSLPC